MSQINILQIVKSAGKLLFDLEPEVTEVLALQVALGAGNAMAEVVPVLIEAYRCQKSRITAYFHREEPRCYRLAA